MLIKSNYSFLEGASHPHEYVEQSQRLGLDTMILCDRDGVYGAARAWVAVREQQADVRLVLGSELTIDDGSTITLLAQTRQGWANLCRLITWGRRRCAKGASEVTWGEVCARAEGCLALWGGERSLLVRRDEAYAEVAGALREAFGDRLYAVVLRHRRAEEVDQEARLVSRARKLGVPIAAGYEVLYHVPERRELHDILTCVAHGVCLSKAGDRLKPNAEHALKAPHAFRALFRDEPGWIARAREIGERCRFSLDELRYVYPSETLPDGRSSAQRLRELSREGARARYGAPIPAPVRAQLDDELALIEELDYGGYFLTMKEIVEFCRREGILCQGRGSAANSAVCYCLGITAVDPVRMDLLFERFLSRERDEPPDIDLDIEHQRREEVIQWVYERYGRDRAAMVANVIRYRPRSAVRDVGKALDIPATALDRVAKMLSRGAGPTEELLRGAGLDPESAQHARLMRFTEEILDFPRHLSIHPGGFLLGQEPVHDLVPIENGAMEGRTVIQWDKYDVEALGLFKVDLLGLGALTHLHLCFDLLREHRGVELSMARLPVDDEATYDMLCEGDTVGVFQIESRAQMNMLPRLRPRCYYDLVIEVSIVRPGPITGEMVHPYLRRRNGEEPVTYPHPSLEPVLERTLGVPLFQEQVMRLAVVAAGYSPGEADGLRRDMGMWRAEDRIEQHRARMIEAMLARGIDQGFAERIFNQIRGFASYGFPESHAASFALICYATAYLRRHYPAEFTCALLNAQPMGFYRPSTIVEDARHHGVEVRPIDVLWSRWDCTLEKRPDGGFAVRMGFRFLKGLREQDWRRIDRAREQGAFRSVRDLVRRSGVCEGALVAMAEAGALGALESRRRDAIWKVKGHVKTPELALELGEDEPAPGFEALDDFETIAWDYRTSHHSPRGHPIAPLRAQLLERGWPSAAGIRQMAHDSHVNYAGLVICRQRPGTASGTLFMTLEDETGFVNLIVWPRVYERFELLCKTQSFLGVTGQLQSESGVVHVIAQALWRPRVGARPRGTGSRDFH